MTPAIAVSQLSKVYKLYRGPRSLFKEIVLGIASHHRIQALERISFEVKSGETFGLIGDNGAGKSTLLKIITGTTLPSTGTVSVNGRASALLELGAGFHQEFTGRQNIYFNGALMGFSREEIREREESIIAFSELEQFIDEPVKTYSSGMYVRLGFSVATGFDPSILVIDEALAVGDQRFQKKCTDLILDFRRKGITILFCSHNLYQVRTLCDRALWLNQGQVEGLGPADEMVDLYTDLLRDEGSRATAYSLQPTAYSLKRICWIEEIRILDHQGNGCQEFQTGETLRVEVRAHFASEFRGTPGIGIALIRNDGVIVYSVSNIVGGSELKRLGPEEYLCTLEFPDLPLLSGVYSFNVVTTDQENLQAYDAVEKTGEFTVRDSGPDGGLLRLPHVWR
ncbi:MAG: ABC transporter ATP-binding protein [Acidobacteriota bacterium]